MCGAVALQMQWSVGLFIVDFHTPSLKNELSETRAD